jgi:hypothetical protein
MRSARSHSVARQFEEYVYDAYNMYIRYVHYARPYRFKLLDDWNSSLAVLTS